jgi:hypothetical protein
MLKPADYLVANDFWAGPGQCPPPPQIAEHLDRLRRSFQHDDLFGPHDVEAALRAALIAAEHLSDTVPQARLTLPDAASTARLPHGHNLLAGYAAQTLKSLADLVTYGTGPNLLHLTRHERADVSVRLGVASRRFQEAAESLRLAHLRVPAAGDCHD